MDIAGIQHVALTWMTLLFQLFISYTMALAKICKQIYADSLAIFRGYSALYWDDCLTVCF